MKLKTRKPKQQEHDKILKMIDALEKATSTALKIYRAVERIVRMTRASMKGAHDRKGGKV